MRRAITAAALSLILLVASVLHAPPSAEAAPPPFAAYRSTFYPFPLAEQNTGDKFGFSVAIDGDVMVVGCPKDDSAQGSIYISERVNGVWSDPVKYVSPARQVGAEFGTSVDVSGNRIIVGEPYRDVGATANAGAAFVFKRMTSSWVIEMGGNLAAPIAITQGGFGTDVAIDGDNLVVGWPGNDDAATSAGAVCPYHWNGSTWTELGYSSPPLTHADDRTGNDVEIDGDMIVASSPGWDPPTRSNVGAVHAWKWNSTAGQWQFDQTILPPPAEQEEGMRFCNVALSGTRLVVGADGKDVGGLVDAGSAYVFNRPLNEWDYFTTLRAATPAQQTWFGISTACEGDAILVGAYFEDAARGAVYAYTTTYGVVKEWPKITRTLPAGAQFGYAVALSEGTLLVGAFQSSSVDTPECGAAYVFTSRGTVSGTVRDAYDGGLLPGKHVYALPVGAAEGDWQAPFGTVVDGSGNYSLSVDAGTYIILVQDPDGQYYQSFYNGFDMYSQGNPVTVSPNGTVSGINFGLDRINAVYRFYNVVNNTHFYTDSRAEVKHVKATWPDIFQYEGIVYVTDSAADQQPLYRFYNRVSQSHFYTASEGERDYVIATWPHIFSYEGPTYKVSVASGPWKAPIHRFYNMRNGSHFYTASETEKTNVIATWPHVYRYEGPAFYYSP